jgi:hypothetical protein
MTIWRIARDATAKKCVRSLRAKPSPRAMRR